MEHTKVSSKLTFNVILTYSAGILEGDISQLMEFNFGAGEVDYDTGSEDNSSSVRRWLLRPHTSIESIKNSNACRKQVANACSSSFTLDL